MPRRDYGFFYQEAFKRAYRLEMRWAQPSLIGELPNDEISKIYGVAAIGFSMNKKGILVPITTKMPDHKNSRACVGELDRDIAAISPSLVIKNFGRTAIDIQKSLEPFNSQSDPVAAFEAEVKNWQSRTVTVKPLFDPQA